MSSFVTKNIGNPVFSKNVIFNNRNLFIFNHLGRNGFRSRESGFLCCCLSILHSRVLRKLWNNSYIKTIGMLVFLTTFANSDDDIRIRGDQIQKIGGDSFCGFRSRTEILTMCRVDSFNNNFEFLTKGFKPTVHDKWGLFSVRTESRHNRIACLLTSNVVPELS